MNKIKKIFIISLAAIGAIGSTVYLATNYQFTLENGLHATNTYEIKLDLNNGRVKNSQYNKQEDTVLAKTNTKNPLTIGYKNALYMVNNDNIFAQLKKEQGQYYNTTAITNIKEINVTFDSKDASGIKYAVGKTPNPQNFTYSSDGKINLINTAKDNYYFTLAAGNSAAYLKTVTIKYSCDTYINGEKGPGELPDSTTSSEESGQEETLQTLIINSTNGNVTEPQTAGYYDGETKTSNGIKFEFTDCLYLNNYVCQMNKGSKYWNTTPLKLKTIKINYDEGKDKKTALTYGNSINPTSNSTIITKNTEYDISGASYFAITGPKYVKIKEITITYLGTGIVNPDTSSETENNNSSSSETTSQENTSTDSGSSDAGGSGEDISYNGYYQGITSKMSGYTLLNNLRTIISKNHHNPGYDGLYDVYEAADSRPDGLVNDYYSNTSNFHHHTDKAGNYKGEGDVYNREHSIPKSWWGGSENNQGSDPFIVYPTDGYVNNKRSNFPFGEVDPNNIEYASDNSFSLLGASKYKGYKHVNKVFEPNDQYKGDFARVYFYAIARYENAPSWTADNGASTFTNNGNFGLTEYASKLFLKWHKQDPVSPYEANRNNKVYEMCNNRNPFIDHPELVSKIWGTTSF